jgi:hypothetical protein
LHLRKYTVKCVGAVTSLFQIRTLTESGSDCKDLQTVARRLLYGTDNVCIVQIVRVADNRTYNEGNHC